MQFTISRASVIKASPAQPPCKGATWDKQRQTWVVDVRDLDHMRELARLTPSGLIIGSDGDDITLYDDYVE